MIDNNTIVRHSLCKVIKLGFKLRAVSYTHLTLPSFIKSIHASCCSTSSSSAAAAAAAVSAAAAPPSRIFAAHKQRSPLTTYTVFDCNFGRTVLYILKSGSSIGLSAHLCSQQMQTHRPSLRANCISINQSINQ